MIKKVRIQNFKSIRQASVPLDALNVLIGSNGVGKSNFISFFELTKSLFHQRFGAYTMDRGGMDNLLHKGRKVSEQISGLLDFDNRNAFEFVLRPKPSGSGYIAQTADYFNFRGDTTMSYHNWHKKVWDTNVDESALIENPAWRAGYIKYFLDSFTVYHFHDTSASSPMRGLCQIGDNEYLRESGSNLAAYLYSLSQTDRKAFDLIEATVRSIAPYFKRFDLKPDRNLTGQISLEWQENDSDMYLNGYSFSDGTIRFMALATLLLQSKLPQVIIIDEPELGLHPAAINKFAAMVKRAALSCQVILSTQSANLVNCFEPEDIIVVDRADGQTVFRRLDSESLSVWLDDYDYSMSDVWEKNLIGGQL
ncbi:MAG: AAA family ATPase [Bacteroidales bacterium]|nr:AAA family ATPase [Bacteroidales bacterium]